MVNRIELNRKGTEGSYLAENVEDIFGNIVRAYPDCEIICRFYGGLLRAVATRRPVTSWKTTETITIQG